MDIRSLKYFEVLARHGSFTKAAAELGISQPSLSVAISKLEDELGVLLFTREARRVVPRPEARLLLARVEKIVDEFNSARREIQAASELRVGEVRIGMPPMFGQVYLPPLLSAFHDAYPEIVITAMEGSAEEVRTMLDRGAIDLGLLENRRVPSGWDSVEVGSDETVLCVDRHHRLADRSTVDVQELDGLAMAVFERSFLQRSVLDELCKKAGVSYRIVIQTNFVPLIHEAAANGLGAATLLRSLTGEDRRLVPLSFDPPSTFTFSLCWRRGQALSSANRSLVDFATDRYRRKPA